MRERIATINVGNIPRKLFTVQERTSGDLTIVIKQAMRGARPGTFVADGSVIVESHQSVHLSPRIPENVIKYTLRYADDTKRESFVFTKAIKQKNAIACLRIRRCENRITSIYDYKGDPAKIFSLGTYDPTSSQLIYMVGVSSSDRDFTLYGLPDFDHNSFIIGRFRVIVIWSFFMLPSNSSSTANFFRTFPADEMGDNHPAKDSAVHQAILDGLADDEFIALFLNFRARLRDDFISYSTRDDLLAGRNFDASSPEGTANDLRTYGSVFFANTSENNVWITLHKRRYALYLWLKEWKFS